jgi:hypothetical protein
MNPTWSNLDPARKDRIERALNVSGAGTVLLQTFINRVVQQLTLREFGAQSNLARRPGSGDAAYINRRTAGTTGGDWVADTDTITEETGSYAQASFPYRTLATRGRVTRKLQATGRSYGDVLAEELTAKTDDFANALETALLTGDTNADANQINGLITLINNQSAQVVAQTTAAAGDDITLAKLDECIDKVKGSASRSDLAILGSFNGLRKLNAALQSQQQFNDVVEIAAGFRVRTYDMIPLIVTTAMPDDMTWSTNTISALSGGSTTALAVINLRYWWIEELTPLTVMPLAKTTSQNDAFDLFGDLALCQANTLGGSLLGGIAGS